MKKIFSFLKNYYFYTVADSEKQMVREKVLKEDYKPFIILMFAIVFFQLFMVIRSCLTYGISPELYTTKPHVIQFRTLYIALIVVCLVASGIATILKNAKMKYAYFVCESITMFLINLWGIGISLLDSWDGIDMATFAYVTIMLGAMITLEPWVVSLDCLLSTVIINLLFYFDSSTHEFYMNSSSVLVNSITIFLMANIICIFQFYRRVNKIKLESKINVLNEKLEKRSLVDELTGLYNRRYLTQHINDALLTGYNPTCLMMADLDYFKKLNDNFGHVVGDKVLQEVGKVIMEVVGNNGYAVRYGGEEFLLHFNSLNKNQLLVKAEELRKKVSEIRVEVEEEIFVHFTISIGLSMANSRISYSGLITVADENLYNAKTKKNCFYPSTIEDLHSLNQ